MQNPFKDSMENLRQNADLERARNRHLSVSETSRHIGCPLSWFKRVFSLVRGKNELAVALYIYRLRTVQRRRVLTVSNIPLLVELGIDRYAKYRALRRLAGGGVITIQQSNKRATTIIFNDRSSKNGL
jgi:hypothetical protein